MKLTQPSKANLPVTPAEAFLEPAPPTAQRRALGFPAEDLSLALPHYTDLILSLRPTGLWAF